MHAINRRIATLALVALLTAGCSAVLPYLVKGAQLAQWVAAIVDQVEQSKSSYFDARPSPDLELQIDQAIAKARGAIAALDSATLSAEATHDGDVETAKRHLVSCYEELYRLLEGTPLLGEGGELLGAAPGVAAERIPTPADLRGRL